MITRDAIYSVIENLIAAAAPGSALENAESARNIRTSVDEAEKLVRVECFDGKHCLSGESQRRELMVRSTIQCWVTPAEEGQGSLDAASDLSFEMSREIFEHLAVNTHLSGAVCDSYFEDFETGDAQMGSKRRGATYLDGVINQAS